MSDEETDDSKSPDETTWVPHSQQIDLTTWSWGGDNDEGLLGVILRGAAAIVTQVLRSQFERDPPRVNLPAMWRDSDGHGGPPVTDPVMLYVDLPLGANENACAYAVSLERVVDDLIESHTTFGTNKVEDDDSISICTNIATRLRELADKLENACASDQQQVTGE